MIQHCPSHIQASIPLIRKDQHNYHVVCGAVFDDKIIFVLILILWPVICSVTLHHKSTAQISVTIFQNIWDCWSNMKAKSTHHIAIHTGLRQRERPPYLMTGKSFYYILNIAQYIEESWLPPWFHSGHRCLRELGYPRSGCRYAIPRAKVCLCIPNQPQGGWYYLSCKQWRLSSVHAAKRRATIRKYLRWFWKKTKNKKKIITQNNYDW